MSTKGAGRAEDLFHRALELTSLEREAFIEKECLDDPSLRAEVGRLLAADLSAQEFFRQPAIKFATRSQSREGDGAGASDDSRLLLERLLGQEPPSSRYRLEGEVARGGMGVIFKVRDENLQRDLAMKVILEHTEGGEESDPTSLEASTLERFLEEARVTGQLDHPGIVPVHELGLDAEGRVYFTMKLVKGRDLRSVFELARGGEEGWTRTRALGVLLKVCEAMAYAHSKGVIHRDLKPSNVMVGKYGEVFVMDWGLARVAGRQDLRDVRIQPRAKGSPEAEGAGSSLVTMDGAVIGTPAYMPPEQALGQVEKMGPHSDVYSVGAMLYELIAGRKPYSKPGQELNAYEVWELVRKGPPEALHERSHDAPPELVAICERAMARDSGERYRDMSLLAADLSAFQDHRVVSAYQTGALAELRKWMYRNKALAGSLIALLLVLALGLAISLILKAKSDHNASLAHTNEELAQSRLDDILRLAAFQELEDLTLEADELWPPYPQHMAPYVGWLDRAKKLVARLEPNPAEGDPGLLAQLTELQRRTESLSDQGGPGGEPEAPNAPTDASREMGDRWWRSQLQKLVQAIRAFADPETGLIDGLSPEHGWGVARRLAWAKRVVDLTVAGDRAAAAWAEAVSSISDPGECPAYAGLEIEPQLGLLPIGRDPSSGFWEFAHLQTGEPAERGAEGRLILTERTGLVFILLPGGTFSMGAQDDDAGLPGYDKWARPDEKPVHQVDLSPFFVSKYEMTQAQWLRITGTNPSLYSGSSKSVMPGYTFTVMHPVESVTWLECQQVLKRCGLALPTEAQWEYAARGNTNTPWWTGEGPETLEGCENLADLSNAKWLLTAGQKHEEWDDLATFHAAVGSYKPNPFGLFDVLGNVAEWCRDEYDVDSYQNDGKNSVKDPLRISEGEERMVFRGGAFCWCAEPQSRSSFRNILHRGSAIVGAGVRPMRPLRP